MPGKSPSSRTASRGSQQLRRISEALFSGDIASLTGDDLQQLELDGLPCSSIAADSAGIVEVLVATELAKSNKMAREFLGNNAVSVNGQLVTEPDFQLTAGKRPAGTQYFVLKRGKKLFHLGKLAG